MNNIILAWALVRCKKCGHMFRKMYNSIDAKEAGGLPNLCGCERKDCTGGITIIDDGLNAKTQHLIYGCDLTRR